MYVYIYTPFNVCWLIRGHFLLCGAFYPPEKVDTFLHPKNSEILLSSHYVYLLQRYPISCGSLLYSVWHQTIDNF